MCEHSFDSDGVIDNVETKIATEVSTRTKNRANITKDKAVVATSESEDRISAKRTAQKACYGGQMQALGACPT